MPRRITALFCTFCLLLTLFLPSHAATEVCFTAVNDTILSLTANSMPVWSGGTLYVPYSVFDAGTTGASLGTSSIYNKNNGTVSVFNVHQIIVFDLEKGTCIDQHSGESISARAILRNGTAYLPAAKVCSLFNMSPPSYLYTEYGNLVRIKNENAAHSDASFIDAASNSMSNRLRDYNQSLSPTQTATTPTPTTTPSTAPSTSTPPSTPSTPNVIQQPDPETYTIPTYLAFRCNTQEACDTILQTLEQSHALGIFFFPADIIGQQGNLIRHILGSGHQVGIMAEESTQQEVFARLDSGNQALDAVAHSRTYFALIPEEYRQSACTQGWVCWDDSLNMVANAQRTPSVQVRRLLQSLPEKGSAYLTLDDSQATANLMDSLLQQLQNHKYIVSIPQETCL